MDDLPLLLRLVAGAVLARQHQTLLAELAYLRAENAFYRQRLPAKRFTRQGHGARAGRISPARCATKGRSKRYLLRLQDGERLVLDASSRESAITAALAHFSATLESEEPERANFARNPRIELLLASTSAPRWQIEALVGMRGIGDVTCRKLCAMIGQATLDGVLDTLRGKTRTRAGEILLMLNRRSPPGAEEPLMMEAPAAASSSPKT